MRFLSITFLFLICLSLPVAAQKLPEVEALNRVIINHGDSIIHARVLPLEGNAKVKVKNDRRYYWYASHDIKTTQGGFDGKLLHGDYTEFYHDKELKVKGQFKKGLKSGSWKSWQRNGQLIDVVSYRKGFRHGGFAQYDQAGNVARKGTYKKGKLHGKQKVYVSSGDPVVEQYKNGEEVIAEPKDTSGVKQKKFLGIFKRKTKTPADQTVQPEEGKKKRRSKKEPKIRVRRSIKVVPQEVKPTT